MDIQNVANKLSLLGIKAKAVKVGSLQGIQFDYLPENLENLVIPDGIEYIGLGEEECTSRKKMEKRIRLQRVKLPKTLKVIGECMFSGCR